jgi:hypothetical protein
MIGSGRFRQLNCVHDFAHANTRLLGATMSRLDYRARKHLAVERATPARNSPFWDQVGELVARRSRCRSNVTRQPQRNLQVAAGIQNRPADLVVDARSAEETLGAVESAG